MIGMHGVICAITTVKGRGNDEQLGMQEHPPTSPKETRGNH